MVTNSAPLLGRLKALEKALPVILERLGKLTPPPVRQPLPILIGGGGEKVTLRLVAKYASMWNIIAEPGDVKRKNDILNGYCQEIGRDPAEIERTVVLLGDNSSRESAGVSRCRHDAPHPWHRRAVEFHCA